MAATNSGGTSSSADAATAETSEEVAAMTAEADLIDEEEDKFEYGVTISVSYESEEESRLQERFGSVYSISDLITSAIDEIIAESAATQMNIEYSYRKIKNLPFKEEDLSSFKQEEAEQTVSVSTTYVTGITTMGESY